MDNKKMQLIDWLRLARLPNLLMVGLIFILFREGITRPVLFEFGGSPVMGTFDLSLLITAAVFLTLAAYLINDYFDQDIDRMNRPKTSVVGRMISGRKVLNAYLLINFIAIMAALVLSIRLGNWQLSVLFFIAAGLMWFYSERYKRKLFIGNLIVAIMAGMSIVISWLFDFSAMLSDPIASIIAMDALSRWLMATLAFAMFAFLTTLSREIVKDLEDMKGDERFGCRTLPIVLGQRTSLWVIASVNSITIGLLLFCMFLLWDAGYSATTIWLALPLSLEVYVTISVFFSSHEKAFHQSSQILKLIMTLGILSMLFIRIEYFHG